MNQPPNDELAEQSLLGAMLLTPDNAIPAVLETVSAEDYYHPKHQSIHRAIVDVFTAGTAVDPVAVGYELEARGQLVKTGGAPYLLDLIQIVALPSNYRVYAAAVVEKARLRRLAELGVRLQQLAFTEGHDSSEILSQAQCFFRDIEQPDCGAADFAELIEMWSAWNERSDDVIATPWPEVNDWLNGGLAKGRLVTIGGRPSVGKSLGGLNIAANAAEFGHPAVFFSLEMSKQEVMTRILSSGGSVEMGQVIRRRLEQRSVERIAQYCERNKAMPLYVDDREKVTVEQIAARCRGIPNLEVAVIDYLQLVTASDSKVSREQQVAHISRSLKIMARELNIAVVVAAQLNRGPVRDGRPREPTIADLRESGAVEQDSDQVLLLHRDDQDESIVRLICGKNRVGRTGSVELKFEGKYARLTPLTDEDQFFRDEVNF